LAKYVGSGESTVVELLMPHWVRQGIKRNDGCPGFRDPCAEEPTTIPAKHQSYS
jgi:hypothetical protein